jgi:hypothetical protein
VLLIALLAGSVLNYNAAILIGFLAASGLDVSGCNTPPKKMKKLLCICALLALVGSSVAEPVRIVAYGDSITLDALCAIEIAVFSRLL